MNLFRQTRNKDVLLDLLQQNRQMEGYIRDAKQSMAESNSHIESIILSLQNLQYEGQHLQSEIDICNQQDNLHKDLDLCSENDYREITNSTSVDEHEIFIERLNLELKERQMMAGLASTAHLEKLSLGSKVVDKVAEFNVLKEELAKVDRVVGETAINLN